MRHLFKSAALFAAVLALVVSRGDAQDGAGLREAEVLDDAFQSAIAAAEPSIACLLVSKSDKYQRWFGDAAPKDEPGKLGDYRPERARFKGTAADQVLYLAELDNFRKAHNPFDQVYPETKLRRKLDLAQRDYVPDAFGSGVVVDEKGLVLTNYHVVRDATKVYVRLPGGKGSYADIHAADPRSDLAVLRLLDSAVLPVKAIKIGDGGAVRKGKLVLSLANPFNAGHRDGSPSASWGIVSNIRRRQAPGKVVREEDLTRTPLHQFGMLLQTDARLNLGCSGGALLDLKGQLIGLTTSLAAIGGGEAAGGFAVPLDADLRRIVDVLRAGREVEYGFLGVSHQPDPDGGDGVRIQYVSQGSPAERAGLQPGGRVTAIGGKRVRDVDDLFLAIGLGLAGNRVEVTFIPPSGGPAQDLTVTLGKFYLEGKVIASVKPPAVRGLRVDYASVLALRRPGLNWIPPGVYAREVQAGSPADAARLQDAIITHVNGRPVRTPQEFYREAEGKKGPLELTLLSREAGQSSRNVTLD